MSRHKKTSVPPAKNTPAEGGRVAARRAKRHKRNCAVAMGGALLVSVMFATLLAPNMYDANANAATTTAVSSAILTKFDSASAASSDDLMSSGAASRGGTRSEQGEWSMTSGDEYDSTRITAIHADNPVVKALINGRDLGATPDGFDPDHATGDSGSNSYPYGQCTWWAYQRRTQLGLPVSDRFGDAHSWADNARRLGYWVDSTPRAGDIVVFQAGQQGADATYGHVAVVEHVADDGTVTISEANVNGQIGPFSRDIDADAAGGLEYIHY